MLIHCFSFVCVVFVFWLVSFIVDRCCLFRLCLIGVFASVVVVLLLAVVVRLRLLSVGFDCCLLFVVLLFRNVGFCACLSSLFECCCSLFDCGCVGIVVFVFNSWLLLTVVLCV